MLQKVGSSRSASSSSSSSSSSSFCIAEGCGQRATLGCAECPFATYCGLECATRDYVQHHRYEHHVEMCSNHSHAPSLLSAALREAEEGFVGVDEDDDDYSASYEWEDGDTGHLPLSSYVSSVDELLRARVSRRLHRGAARRPIRGGHRGGRARKRGGKRGKGWRKAVTRAKDAGLTFAQKAKRRRIPVETFRKRVLKNPHFYESKTVRQARMHAAIYGTPFVTP